MKAVILNSRPIAQVARELISTKELSGTGSPLTGGTTPTRSRRSISTNEPDFAKPNGWFGN